MALFFSAALGDEQGDGQTDAEVRHLLDFVGSSNCTFVRNGTEYGADEARRHLKMKYGYARPRLHSTEEFIDKVASQSSLSGKQYEVRCGDAVETSKQWLIHELRNYRRHRPPGDGQSNDV